MAYMFATEGAYKLSDDSREGNPPPDRIADPEKKNWIGYIAVSELEDGMRDIAIMFRGTITRGEWETNFCGNRLTEWDPRQPEVGGKLHHGFRATYWETGDSAVRSPRATVRRAVNTLLCKYGKEIGSVTVAGHSLGGALATVAAYDVALHLQSSSLRAKLRGLGVEISDQVHVSAITFGAPRVGNPAFKDALKKAGVPVLRVVNMRDVVPLWPGLCSTAVVKTFRLFGIDARVPGNGVGNVLKYINRGISKWPCLGKIAYEHTDAEWIFFSDEITYKDGESAADNKKRPLRALQPHETGPRHNLEVHLYLVATQHGKEGEAIERDARLMNKGDWCLEANWLREQGLPDTPNAAPIQAAEPQPAILVVGSVNVDIIAEVGRLPSRGETLTATKAAAATAVGGKGANQAVAAARLITGRDRAVRFVGCFGKDSHAAMLEAALVAEGVDVSQSRHVRLPSGQGWVLLEPDGTATSVVLGGSNTAFEQEAPGSYAQLMEGMAVVLLQREVPEHVNEAVAAAAAAAGVPVLQDVGGEDRPLSDALLSHIDYLAPNESELGRLTGLPTATQAQALTAAASLTARGAHSVLVTLAERGALLVYRNGTALHQPPVAVPGGAAVDGTAAGDAFRAAFAVGLAEGLPVQTCLRLAAAAGAIAVSRVGAVPSLPRREEVERLAAGATAAVEVDMRLLGKSRREQCRQRQQPTAEAKTSEAGSRDQRESPEQQPGPEEGALPGSDQAVGTCSAAANGCSAANAAGVAKLLPPLECPLRFASRLNCMQARRDLAGPVDGPNTVLGWIQRQSRIKGLSLVDLNHPQHTQGVTSQQLQAALSEAGLAAGAINIRFPEAQFGLGSFSNPDAGVRAQAVALAAEGCRWAAELGAGHLVVWPQFDGYNYHLQVDYQAAWQRTVEAFQQLVDACPPHVRVSLEFKSTDEATRYAIVPSTAAALLLGQHIGRPKFGLTLDFGHLLMAGENPAQSVALAAQAGMLFGLHLNDAHVKLGAEDGLAFGSVNPIAALELVRWLQRVGYEGHIYFDTFPRSDDPVREAELNIRRFKALWTRAARLAAAGVDGMGAAHDALGVLELLEQD
ncbi:hypothetical protein N2152v2_009901 [Parachlorella kessleri]